MKIPPNVSIYNGELQEFETWKDIRSKFIVTKALQEGVQTLCLITSGNAGYALAKLALPAGMRVVCIIDSNLKQNIKQELSQSGAEIIEKDLSAKFLTQEEVMKLCRKDSNEYLWDVTNGFSDAYSEMIPELQQLNPDFIVCPVGSGEAFLGILKKVNDISIKSKLIGVGTESHPSIADKLSTPWSPYESALKKAVETGHQVIRLSEDKILNLYNEYKDTILSEPSSTVIFAALKDPIFQSDKTYLLINSGKGLF